MTSPKNLKKRFDSPTDVIVSRKTDKTSNLSELYFDFELNKLQYKKGVNNIIDVSGSSTPTPEYQEIVVNISSAQILAMGTTPVELLPAPGVGKYYDVEKIIFEYTHNTTTWTDPGYWRLYGGISNCFIGASDMLESPSNSVHITTGKFNFISEGIPFSTMVEYSTNILNQAVMLQNVLIGGVDFKEGGPSGGDGTLRLILKYKVRTFGE